MLMNKSWFSIKAKADGAEISIHDEIGAHGLTASDFIKALEPLSEVKAITLRINSPGGSVFDGLAIYNALKRHPATITAVVDGIAASMASVILMAADKVVMPENALLMVHNPSAAAAGTADEMRKTAEALDKARDSLVTAYSLKTQMAPEALADLMAAETWLSAAEAVAAGFADEIERPVKMVANFDLSAFRNAPASLATAAARIEMQAYAAEVATLCAVAGCPERSGEFIAAGSDIATIRAKLLAEKAKAAPDISNHHHAPANQDSGWDAVYARVGK